MTSALAYLPAPAPGVFVPEILGEPAAKGIPKGSPKSLDALRLQMGEIVAAGRNAGPSLSTGIPHLDQELGGGIPRGRVTEVTGSLGAGKTALLRQVVARVLAAGQWVAWIDARRTLAPQPWAELGKRFVVVRPREVKRAAWCADLLLRSGVFALVVLDGAPIVARNVGFRLAQIARERDAAFVVMSEEEKATRISGTLRLRVERGVAILAHTSVQPPALLRPQRLRQSIRQSGRRRSGSEHAPPLSAPSTLTISSLKSGHSLEVACAVPASLARSLCAHPEIPDRRGVALGSRRPWAPKSGSNTHEQEGHAVSWGGLGAATVDHAGGRPGATTFDRAPEQRAAIAARGNTSHLDAITSATRSTEHTTSHDTHIDTTRTPIRSDTRSLDNTRPLTAADIERSQREVDRIARNWSRFARGRHRAAESTWGRPTRRERARERTGAHLESHLGQGWGKLVGKGRVEPKPRPPLGRVAEGVG